MNTSFTRLMPTIAMFVLTLTFGSSRADLVWENEFLDEAAITNNLMVAAGGTTLTFQTTIFSDSDGGTFDLAPVRSADYFSFEADTSGNHTGYLEMTFDNENDDPDDYIELSIQFNGPVSNLQFSLLDVDGNSNFNWDDGVEVSYNGVNTKTDSNLFSIGAIVFLDNETYMDGFEAGNATAASNETIGNIDFDFAGEVINNITIRYFSTDDANDNPGSQFIGLSDLSFDAVAVPEPSAIALALLGGLLTLSRRKRA